ncbi:DUF2087 domain-containing protein [Nocardiopsis sp. NPDC006938]|uniref:DUF2087 domain-containing protein n=1 Tax=Nocardiopsis sp. NPDC006938 TaxID=3364337 RepID=UPI0036C27976
MPHPTQLVSSLASPDRLSLFARIVSAGPEGWEPSGPGGAAGKHLDRLLKDGLVCEEDGRIVAVPEVFAEAMREHKAQTRVTDPVDALFHEGRLTSMPARRDLRLAVLERLCGRLFAPELEYTEKQVNTALLTCFDDPSALRRYLVEEGFLEREDDGSRYRRSRS